MVLPHSREPCTELLRRQLQWASLAASKSGHLQTEKFFALRLRGQTDAFPSVVPMRTSASSPTVIKSWARPRCSDRRRCGGCAQPRVAAFDSASRRADMRATLHPDAVNMSSAARPADSSDADTRCGCAEKLQEKGIVLSRRCWRQRVPGRLRQELAHASDPDSFDPG